MFFLKRKKIVVDAFTYNSAVHQFSPIVKSTHLLPEWWKQLPSTYNPVSNNGIMSSQGTMKRCDGFTELYRNTFTVPLWSDLIIETFDNANFTWLFSASAGTEIVSHSREQYGSAFDKFIHLKLGVPWALKEKTGVNFYYTQPTWNHIPTLTDVIIPPGIINFKDQCTLNVNMFVPLKNNRLELDCHTPLATLVPMSENTVEIKCHLIDYAEFQKIDNISAFNLKFKGGYKFKKALSKCPFH